VCVTFAAVRSSVRLSAIARDAEASVRCLEQDRAAVRTRVGLIEGGGEGFLEQVRKENRLWYCVVVQRNRLR
jgi:hypothetical protein